MYARERFKHFQPFDARGECPQLCLLAFAPKRERLDDFVAHGVKEFGPVLLRRAENIARELPIMRALLNNDEIVCPAELLPDFCELCRYQFPKKRADADVREIIAFATNRSAPARVIAMLGMIERLLHEPGKRDRATFSNLRANNFNECGISGFAVHCQLMQPCQFSARVQRLW